MTFIEKLASYNSCENVTYRAVSFVGHERHIDECIKFNVNNSFHFEISASHFQVTDLNASKLNKWRRGGGVLIRGNTVRIL